MLNGLKVKKSLLKMKLSNFGTYLRVEFFVYSVMQSDGNSFCGYVVLDSFNKASRDEDSILSTIIDIANIFFL